ncbi:MAG: sugar transferase [Clostridia bacterium]|nr:sugar transferase [Clostridia bacterium]
MEELKTTVVEEQVNTEIAEDVVMVKSNVVLKKKPVYDFVKRCFDVIASFLFSIVFAIPMILVALLIMKKDNGTPFYQQQRMGKNGKKFGVYKFRSMRIGADNLEEMLTPEQLEEYRREYKLKDDPRLIGYEKPGDGATCFGAKIRKTSIDEIPQIFMNILVKGNMSVVGPRPILEEELFENYTPDEQKMLLSVKPGLTGYWQAYARNNVSYEDGERQNMELYYVENRSVFLDIKILFKTVESVIRKSGAK